MGELRDESRLGRLHDCETAAQIGDRLLCVRKLVLEDRPLSDGK